MTKHSEITRRPSLLRRLWRDECGGMLSTEYVLLGALLTLGLIVGVHAIRTAIVTEYEDYAAALDGLEAGEVGGVGTTFVGSEGGISP